MARKRITQIKLAEAVGWSQGAVSRRLSGRVPFNIEELANVAEVLGVTVTALVGEVAA